MDYRDRYWYGASYSPLIFKKEDWESDLALMADAGMNIIRMGDVHGSWDKIEPREGYFEFERLDEFYKKASEHGLAIMVSTGSASPPLWLAEKYPDLRILSNTDTRYPLGSSYGWACIHHPGYLDALQRYLQALLEFTAGQENHFGWQISNEIGFPFLPSRGSSELDVFCYCDHCQAEFRAWVKEKYGTLDNVNQAWAWGTTCLIHNDWNDIFAPQGLPSGWASVTKWIDWRLFWQDEFAAFAGWQDRLIKAGDAQHPTSVNTFNFKGFDRFGTLIGLDQWKIAKQVDHVGYDLYPGSGNKLASRPEHNSIFLDHGRSVANFSGSDFWLHEIESGPIGGWVMGPDYNTSEVDILRNDFEAIGHDVKLIMYMPWREWDYQPLHWGALVDLDGNPTPRLAAAKQIGAFIHEHQDILLKSHPAGSEAAILEFKPNAIFFKGVGREEELFEAQRGAYRALWDVGYNLDFIVPEALEQALGRYEMILLPMLGLIDDRTAGLLHQFAQQGGTVVGFARCATLTEQGWYRHGVLPDQLKTVFGIQSVEPDLLNQQKIMMDGEVLDGYWNRDKVVPEPATGVMASFSDRYPAVTINRIGAGKGIYIATQCDAAYVKSHNELLAKVIKSAGLPPVTIDVQYSGKAGRDIDPHLLLNDTGGLIVFTNYKKRSESTRILINSRLCSIHKLKQIFPTRKDISITQRYNNYEIALDFMEEEVKVIQFV